MKINLTTWQIRAAVQTMRDENPECNVNAVVMRNRFDGSTDICIFIVPVRHYQSLDGSPLQTTYWEKAQVIASRKIDEKDFNRRWFNRYRDATRAIISEECGDQKEGA